MNLDIPLETRSGEDDPLAAATAAVEELRTTVSEFRTGIEGRLTTDLRGLTDRVNGIETRIGRPGFGGGNQDGDAELQRRAFDTFVRRGRESLSPDEVRSLRVSDDSAGGYLAPDQFIQELLRNVVRFSPVRSVARVMTTSVGAALLPKRTGTMTASWVGETDDRSETTVTFGQNRYEVRELAAYVDVSNTMLEDSAFDVPGVLSFEFAEEFGRAEGQAFVNGDGVLRPTGFMTDANLAYTPSGDASLVKPDGLIDLFHALAPVYRANGTWMMNSNTLSSVRKLKDGQGRYLINIADLDNGPITTLLGRPIVEAVDMPDVAGGAFPIVFGDFQNAYRIFDRVAISILRDPYSQATKGMTRFHGRRRVAGGIGKAEAIRKLKIGTS